MFEQSILIERPGKTGWSVLLSLTFQLVCVSILIVLPLVFTDHLSAFQWSNILVAPPPPPPLQPLQVRVVSGRSGPTTATALPVFVAPTRIPDRVAMVTDSAPLPSSSVGVPGSTGALGTAVGVLGDFMRTVVPPPPAAAPVQAAQPSPPKQISVSGGVQNAKLIRQVIPVYPALARQARISGTVRLAGIIGKDGTIQNLQLVSGPPLLVDAAFQAVRQWVYRPTLLSGQPVEVVAPIEVIFTLN